MTWIATIDLSGERGSVSLWQTAPGTEPKFSQELELGSMLQHSEELFGALVKLLESQGLKASDISEWWTNEGPGSFTGLRIGLSALKGICASHQTKLVMVNGAEVRAQSWVNENKTTEATRILVMTSSTATRFILHVFNLKAGRVVLQTASTEEVMPSPTKGEVVLTDKNLDRPGFLHWPIRSRLLLQANEKKVLTTKEEIASAAPIYFGAKAFVKAAPLKP